MSNGGIGAVSGIAGMVQATESLLDGIASLLDSAEAQAPVEPGAHAGVRANLGAACRKCFGGHKPVETSACGARPKPAKDPVAEGLIAMLKPLLDMLKTLLDALKSQEQAAKNEAASPVA